MNIGEISNVLTALNAYRLWFTQDHLEYWAMVTVKLGTGNWEAWEMADRELYSYWYELGREIDRRWYLDISTLWKFLIDATNARMQYVSTH
jgi:hypothetical protein